MIVVNRKTPPEELEKIVFNLQGKVRRAKLNGRDHLVVPAVMMTEGVHEGSGGPGYYSEETLAASDFSWNHQPIIVYHAEGEDGSPISARTETVLNSRKIGLVLNTKTSNKKQRFEAWIDYKLAKKVDKRIIECIENGKKIEVSTGIGVKKIPKKGKWNDEKFTWEAHSIVPDHLAVLPDQVGACSIADGAGLLQLNRRGMSEISRRVLLRSVRNAAKGFGASFIKNEMSFSQQSSAVCDSLAAAYGEKGKYWRGWVVEIYPTYVIFAVDYSTNSYWKVSYSVSKDGTITLSDDKTEVVRTTEYKVVKNATEKFVTTNGRSQMKPEIKKKMIAKIVANIGVSKKAAMAMEDGDLRAVYKTIKKEASPSEKESPKVVNRKVVVNGAKLTREQLFELLDPKEKAVLNRGIKAAEKARATHIAVIKANPNCPFKDEFLNNVEACPDSLLEGMAMMLKNVGDDGDDPILRADFTGANGVVENRGKDELPEPLLLGVYNGIVPEKKMA